MADLRASGLGGVPKGATADRPSSPSIGDVFYNGTLGCLEIYTSQGWVPNSAPPGIPSSVVATNQGSGRAFNNGQASVAFSSGSGGGFISDYVVTPSPATSPTTFSGSSSPITVTGLQSSQQYTYTVQARNNFGTSLSSAASAGVTATTVPQAPTIGTANGGDAQASVTFTAGATGGSAITSYTVTSSPGNITASGASSPITVTGLTNGTAYTFTVTATNANGTSAASAASNSVTPAIPVPIDALVIAGGGGCINTDASGGGGGAGGVLLHNLSLLGGVNYTITVGAGSNSTGSDSSITGFGISAPVSKGGGYGGNTDAQGGNGGSGGGNGGRTTATPGQPTAGQGFAGGTGDQNSYPNIGGGGGGGAGGVGKNASAGGHGGPATSAYSTWASHTSSGVGGQFAGGGGATAWYGQPNGNGGGGGAGNGAAAGAANTGSGAGGGNSGAGNPSGGSGIVILRYTGSINAAATTGSPNRYETGGYTYYKFTSSGSITF